MNWPLPQDFNEAVQNPATAFADPDLKSGQAVVGPTGLPLPRSGNFADVYQVRAANNRDWAVKCFTRPVTGLEQRYQKVDEALRKAGLPFTIGFTFLTEGVFVHGKWTPAVKMEWIDGLQLNQVVRDQAGSRKVLDALGQMWSRLCKKLREAGIAHADLQHGNVLLVAGAKPGSYGLKLIDYDGMYVPSLANTPSGESGHPNFQHPLRAVKQVYSPDLDRFPHLAIATALKGLAVLGPTLWERYDTGDNLLFTEDDFRNPAASPLLKELWQTNEPSLQALVGHLAIACGKPIPQTPWLDQIAPEGVPIPLNPDQARNAAAALGVLPPAIAAVIPVNASEYGVDLVAPAPMHELPSFVVPQNIEPLPARRSYRDEPKKSSMMPIAIVAGVLLIGGAVAAGILMSGGKKDETVQTDPDEKKDDDKGKPKPPGKQPKLPPDLGSKSPDPDRDPIVPPMPNPLVPPPLGEFAAAFNFDIADVPTLKQRWQGTTSGIAFGARFTPNGESVVVREGTRPVAGMFASRDGSKGTTAPPDGAAELVDFAFLSDGNIASWQAAEPFAIVWSPATGKAVGKIAVPTPVQGAGRRLFSASPDGRFIVVGRAAPLRGVEAGRIALIEVESGREVMQREVWGPQFRFTQDSKLVIADLEFVKTYSLPDGKETRSNSIPGTQRRDKIRGCSADGRVVLHPGEAGGLLLLIDRGETRKATKMPPRYAAMGGGISDDGRYLAACAYADNAVGDNLSHVEVLDLSTGRLVGRFSLGARDIDVQSIAFAPDNSALVLARSSQRVQVLDMPKGLVAVVPKPKPPEPKVSPKPVDPNPPVMVKKDPPPPTPKLDRKPVPEEASLALAEKKLRESLNVDFAKTLPNDRRALAQKLLALADASADDPTTRYAMFRGCHTIAIEIFEPQLAMQALEGIIRNYLVNADQLKLEAFEKIKEAATDKNITALRIVTEMAMAASDIASTTEDFAITAKYAQAAIASAKRGMLPAALLEEAEGQLAKAKKSAEAFAPVKDAIEKLKADPNDLDAADLVGRYRCFTQGRWDEGTKFLARGATGALKAAAALDAAAPRGGPPDLKLAEAWWDAAQTAPEIEKRSLEYRARYWYAHALPALTGEARTQAENRLGFQSGGVEYRGGLLAEFTAKVPAILQGKKARIDPMLSFLASELKGEGSGVATDLSVRWTGVLAPQHGGRYRIIAVATDPVIVRIDGKVAIDTNSKTARRDALIAIPDRPASIVVEFKCKNTDQHGLKLFWSDPGSEVEVPIPPEVYYHDRKTESVLGKVP